MKNDRMDIIEQLANIAVKSLIYEVSITPKPGLVDRLNNGAHRDMDFFTFIDSAYALHHYFYAAADAGYHFGGNDVRHLFQSIRKPGIEAERAMFRVTGGVNTHKGLIFSFGILFCGAGYLYGRGNELNIVNLSQLCKEMCAGLIDDDFKNVTIDNAATNGEKLYAKYGVTGIRGEAVTGFQTAVDKGCPVLKEAVKAGYSTNDAGLMALFSIMEVLDDTNVLARHNFETLQYVKECAVRYNVNEINADMLSKIEELDLEFIKKNISPGGAADLLAITLALHMIETEFANN